MAQKNCKQRDKLLPQVKEKAKDKDKDTPPPEEFDEKCLFFIEKYGLVFMNEVISFFPESKSTFYEKLKACGSDTSDTIKRALELNKIKRKVVLRNLWLKPDAPSACQIALYKLLADNDERAILNNNTLSGSENNKNESREAYLKGLRNMAGQTTEQEENAD